MSFEEAMAITGRLVGQAQALAALVARLELAQREIDGDPAVNAEIERVAELTGAKAHYDELSDEQRSILLNFAQTYLRQAIDLVDDPGRAAAWSHSDPEILQAQGTASGFVATLMSAAGLGKGATRILDVGTGVAGLAIALCREFPDADVVGVDPFETALALARANVADAGLESRITLRAATIEQLDESEPFDLVWLPTFFIPERALDAALNRIFDLTRSGAEVVLGTFETPEDELARAVDAVFTVRAGGSVLGPGEAIARLERAGFVECAQAERTWQAPLQLTVGRRG
jgi:predicted O-methyltransferase YrrM